MDKIIIKGGKKLHGEVSASGSKNASLPLLFASLLAKGKHTFHNVPILKDVKTSCDLLQHFGSHIQRKNNTLCIHTRELKSVSAPYDLVRKMRAGILSLGPLLAKYKKAKVSLPGGCAIGTRAVDLHLKGLKKMGAHIELNKGLIIGRVDRYLQGAKIVLDYPSVGGTENLMMAAVMAKGATLIENAAKEPEVVDLASYLKKMGACIKGAGTRSISITPTDQQLKPAQHQVIPDRIEAGTLLIAGAITRGNICVSACLPSHLSSLVLKLKEAGFKIITGKDFIRLSSPTFFSSVNIRTCPYPGFPTDLQAQFMALMTQAKLSGVSTIKETVFENRFMHVQELARLGADISLEHNTAFVRASSSLEGAPLIATDLRASACLILAGLAAKGKTTVHRVYHLDRGYEFFEEKLSALGADIQREKNKLN